jgi:hypothetical protein
MASVDGTWFCANFFGDSFELTAFDDGALIMQTLRKRVGTRGDAVRLEPRCDGCWEAEKQIRMRRCGNALLLQHYGDKTSSKTWGPEVKAFRGSFTATGTYFKDFVKPTKCKEKNSSEEEFILERGSSTMFKIEQFSVESAFKKRTSKVKVVDSPTLSAEEDLDASNNALRFNKDSEECHICMTNAVDIVLMPCGHSGLCECCARKIISEDGSMPCPYCRQSVTKIAKISSIEAGASRLILSGDDVKSITDFKSQPRHAWT